MEGNDAKSLATDPRKRNPKDFVFGDILGEGSFSTVVYAKEPSTGLEFAVKVLEKRHIIREKKVKYVTVEKDILNVTRHPFIIKLFYTFQDTSSLYFVLEYASNGDLLSLLRLNGRFDADTTRFYAGQLILAVEYLHKNFILHRDVKPENVLLDDKYHIKLTDFGSAKLCTEQEFLELSVVETTPEIAEFPTPSGGTTSESTPIGSQAQPNSSSKKPSDHKRKASFVGTAEYCSPELLNDRACSPKSDIWALGVVTFQFLAGRHPFRGGSEYQTFQKVLHLEYVFPSDMPSEAKALLQETLVLRPSERITVEAMKRHAFYAGLDWDGLSTAEAPPKKCWSRSRGSTNTNTTILHGSDVSLSELDAEEEEDETSLTSPISVALETPMDKLSLAAAGRTTSQSSIGSIVDLPSDLVTEALKGEPCLRSGILKRRSHFLTKTRGLLVTPTRLVFLDLKKGPRIHSELSLSDLRRVQLKDKHKFYVQFHKGIVHLDDPSGAAQEWVDAIGKVVCEEGATSGAT